MEKEYLNRQAKHLDIGRLSNFSPLKIREMLFDDTPKNLIIEKEGFKLEIPSKTLRKMASFKEGRTKAKAMTRLLTALQDATKITLIPEE